MAEEKIFLVEGETTQSGRKMPFAKKVRAKTAGFAAEKVLCLFGSKNKIRRNRILVKEVKEADKDGRQKEG